MKEDAATPNLEGEPKLPKGSLSGPPLEKIIVAIHGIGSQRRSDTVRSVAGRFGSRAEPPVPILPLGYFHIEKSGIVRVSRLDLPKSEPGKKPNPLACIGFAEVFWADIPRKVEKEEDTLEETKGWGATVISRAQAAYHRKVPNGVLKSQDFQLAAGALDEVIETVDVLENLCTVAARAGVFKFDLAQLLRDYLGDVQLVAEFRYFRQKIVYRFHDAMEQIVKWFGTEYSGRKPELYIVAHSEGTVVSFLGLLEALAGNRVTDPDQEKPPEHFPWIQHVRGFMTIGSPIDKHLILWPKMWEHLQCPQLQSETLKNGSIIFPGAAGQPPRLVLPSPIRWRNYYDFGDPVGFQLDTAHDWLKERHCAAFEFSPCKDDFGFSRYLVPGKAHNDYWNDPEVFGHFIEDVVLRENPSAPSQPPPKNRRGFGFISTAIPYVASFCCHAAAVFILFKAVQSSIAANTASSAGRAGIEIGVLSLLLMGMTVAARVPRLVKPPRCKWQPRPWRWQPRTWKWHALAAAAFLLGAGLYVTPLMTNETRDDLGHLFTRSARLFSDVVHTPGSWNSSATIGLVLLALFVASTGWWVRRSTRIARRTLVFCGTLAVLLIVVGALWEAKLGKPVWPLLLAGAGYLYLWWLGILLFDLAFLWHRYIRNSVAITNLWHWNRGEDAPCDSRVGPQPAKGEQRTALTESPERSTDSK